MKIILDIILINLSFFMAYQLRFEVLSFITAETVPIFDQYLRVLIFITLIWLAVFKLVGLYDKRKFHNLLDELASLFLGVTLSTLILLGLLFLYQEFWVSRLVVVNAWWIAFVLLALERILINGFMILLQKRGWGIKNVLIVGAGEMGQLLALKLSSEGLSYRPIAFLDDDPAKIGQIYHGIKVVDKVEISKIKEIIEKNKVEELLIASYKIPVEKVLDIITECEKYQIEFKIVPGVLELIASRLDIDELGGLPLLTVSEIQLKGFNAVIKRTSDIVFSGAGILALSPFFIIFAALVKITSSGPVLFRQKRIGMDGKPFNMFKFRSMVKDAEKLFPELEPLSETEGHIFKMKNDPRITPLGKFMRRFSVDEFPQLFNVFLGNMSLVGPRPPLPHEVEKYNSWHKKRLRVRPGITGLWQVSGRSLLPFEEMVRLDIYYIENWSLWQDFKILLKTIPVVLFGTGAY